MTPLLFSLISIQTLIISSKISPISHNTQTKHIFLHFYSQNAGNQPPFTAEEATSSHSLIFYPSMATSVSATSLHKPLSVSFHGNWATSVSGENSAVLTRLARTTVRVSKPVRFRPMMKNINEGKGLFAPAVVLARNLIGKKRFNQLRGKAIALHSQIITEFCKSIGADAKQRQGLIRLAKKNGERLGFLA